MLPGRILFLFDTALGTQTYFPDERMKDSVSNGRGSPFAFFSNNMAYFLLSLDFSYAYTAMQPCLTGRLNVILHMSVSAVAFGTPTGTNT